MAKYFCKYNKFRVQDTVSPVPYFRYGSKLSYSRKRELLVLFEMTGEKN